jgi:thioredoxin-dependent peroxiredoxin
MPHPLVGKQAPAITLPDSEGADYTLSPGESGKSIALFFYPKSGSYGCTKEVCQFRDAIAGRW